MNSAQTRIRLRPLQKSDETELAPIFTDRQTLRFYLPTLLRTYSTEQLAGLLADWDDHPTDMILTIVRDRVVTGVGQPHVADEVLGMVNLDGINYTNGNCEIGIAILNEMRGQGAAREALTQAIDYCFKEMRLHRVWCRVMEDNTRSLDLFESMGFRKEGRMREHVNREGRFLDLVVLGVLRGEWD